LLAFACTDRRSQASLPAARSVFAVADSLRTFGAAEPALALYRTLRDSLAEVKDSAGVWKATLWSGYCLMRLGRRDSAEAMLNEAMALAMASRTPDQEAWSHAILSNFLDIQGRFDSALSHATRARELVRQTKDPDLPGAADNALGRIYSGTGKYRAALAIQEGALARTRGRSDPGRIAQALNEVCISYRGLGRHLEAETSCAEALGLFRQIADTDGMARTSLNLGNVYYELDELDSATALYSRALRGYERNQNVRGMALANGNLGNLYRYAKNFSLARRHIERQGEIARPAGLAYSQVLSSLNLGVLEFDVGNLDTARRILETTRRLADSLGYEVQRVSSMIHLSRTARGLKDYGTASRWAELAVRGADSIEMPDLQIDARTARGEAREARRQSSAIDDFLKAIELIESWRGRLALGELGAGAASTYHGAYEGSVREFISRGEPAAAFAVSERAHARLLRTLMAERLAGPGRDSARGRLILQLQAAYAEWQDADDSGRPRLDREVSQLTAALEALDAREARTDPTARARSGQPVALDELRALLLRRSGAGLVAFFWGDRDVYGWWIDGAGVRAARLGPSDSLGALVDFLYRRLHDPRSGSAWQPPAHQAYERLIAPLIPDSVREVFVIPDGLLAYLPLEVLSRSGQSLPLGATHRFAYGPSASVLAALASTTRDRRWQRSVLAVGNPSLDERPGGTGSTYRGGEARLAPLPFAAAEAREIADLFGDGADLLLGQQATLERWLELNPARYRYLHFAAHAQVSDRKPASTRLVLAGSNLELPAIRRLDLRADLVTLSACETGLGRRIRGEGIIGLPYAFLAAGARATLVTLWRVADRSAADFMKEFYQEVHAGRAPADALLTVRHRWISAGGDAAHPSHWAPFILVGAVADR
ncbi:MAG: hypothetical protein QOH59_2763, partial [Gemmatimonadales bacterium]|nr:hypothetical protein [Gemmatimonadales bacterium]